MKKRQIQSIMLLLACVIAGYFFFTTTVPWIFWSATAILAVSLWWGRKMWKQRKKD